MRRPIVLTSIHTNIDSDNMVPCYTGLYGIYIYAKVSAGVIYDSFIRFYQPEQHLSD